MNALTMPAGIVVWMSVRLEASLDGLVLVLHAALAAWNPRPPGPSPSVPQQ